MQGMHLVRSTYPSGDAARVAAKACLDLGAACTHVSMVESSYVWHRAVQQEAEHVLEVRVGDPALAPVVAMLEANHPYDVPLVEHWPVTVNAAYATWAAGLRQGSKGSSPS